MQFFHIIDVKKRGPVTIYIAFGNHVLAVASVGISSSVTQVIKGLIIFFCLIMAAKHLVWRLDMFISLTRIWHYILAQSVPDMKPPTGCSNKLILDHVQNITYLQYERYPRPLSLFVLQQ